MIYAVYIQSEVQMPVTLHAYKSTQVNDVYVCEKSLFINAICTTTNFMEDDFGKEYYIGSGTVFYYVDRDEAIKKYNSERDRRIQICLEQIHGCERTIKDMRNYNPYSIESEYCPYYGRPVESEVQDGDK